MMRRVFSVLLIVILAGVLMGSEVWAEARKITILYSNDINGVVFPAG